MRTTDRPVATDGALDAARRIGDPLADDAVAAILGTCEVPAPGTLAPSAAAAACGGSVKERLARVARLNTVVHTWCDNAEIASWQGDDPIIAPALQPLIAVAKTLPDWACRERIHRAQTLFMDQGVLSVTTLFCASLPESYVLPDLAAVLHATGQLDKRADLRLRATGAMIFPVMMMGGLVPGSKEGGGIAQIVKVRLIHAMVRNLILRAPPEKLTQAARLAPGTGARVPPLALIQPQDTMAAALHAMGWDVDARGVPNDQEELAYTLLTFNFAFLRAMRDLDVPLSDQECEDFIHAWNVAGHFLGIDRALTVDTFDAAAELYGRIQKRGRARWAAGPPTEDPRPHLAAALMVVTQKAFTDVFAVSLTGRLKQAIGNVLARPIPVLLTRYLIGPESSRDLDLNRRVRWWWLSRFVFWTLMHLMRLVDRIARTWWKDFSIGRLVTRAVGHKLLFKLLMDRTRELAVPGTLRPRIAGVVRAWGCDKKASKFMNAVDDRFTQKGDWEQRTESPAP